MALSVPRSRAGGVGLAVAGGVAAGALAAFAGPLYALAGLVGVAVGLVMLASAQLTLLAFVAVATLLPYGVIPVSIGGVRPTFLDVTLGLLLMTWVFGLLARKHATFVSTPVNGALALFLGLAVAAFVFGTAYAVTPETTRQFLKLLNSTLFFFTVVQLVRTRRHLRMLLWALVIGGTVAAAIGIALYHLPSDTAGRLLRALGPLGYPRGEVLRYIEDAGVRTKELRAIGTSIDPNVFGALLLVTGTVSLGQLLGSTRRLRLWLLAAVGLIAYALLLSLSRGSWLGFGTAAAVLTIVRYRWLLWLVPAIAIPAVLSGQLARFGQHFLKAVYARDQATGMRLGEYKDALTLIQQNPWLGVGFGGTPSNDLYLGVSSTYLMIAEEMGLIGLSAFLLVLWIVIGQGVRGYRRLPDDQAALALTCLAAFVGVLISAAVDKHFFDLRYQHISALFWMLAALVILSSRRTDADNGDNAIEVADGAAATGLAGPDGGGALSRDGHRQRA